MGWNPRLELGERWVAAQWPLPGPTCGAALRQLVGALACVIWTGHNCWHYSYGDILQIPLKRFYAGPRCTCQQWSKANCKYILGRTTQYDWQTVKAFHLYVRLHNWWTLSVKKLEKKKKTWKLYGTHNFNFFINAIYAKNRFLRQHCNTRNTIVTHTYSTSIRDYNWF